MTVPRVSADRSLPMTRNGLRLVAVLLAVLVALAGLLVYLLVREETRPSPGVTGALDRPSSSELISRRSSLPTTDPERLRQDVDSLFDQAL